MEDEELREIETTGKKRKETETARIKNLLKIMKITKKQRPRKTQREKQTTNADLKTKSLLEAREVETSSLWTRRGSVSPTEQLSAY